MASGAADTPTVRSRRTLYQLRIGRRANASTPTHQATTRELNQGHTPCSIHDHQAANELSTGVAAATAGGSSITSGAWGRGAAVIVKPGAESRLNSVVSDTSACPGRPP